MSFLDLLADHTYRMMLLGTVIIGFTTGAIGTFAYLRKRTLLADVVSHSSIGGVMLAFIIASTFGIDGRSNWVLILGSAAISLLAVQLVDWLPRVSVTKVDAAMAIVLALFFGGGMVLHRVILAGPYPSKGGLAEYLFGNASHLTVEDIVSSIVVAGATFLLAAIAFKKLKPSCFDPEYAATLGISSRLLSMLLNAVVVLSIVIGLKAVGLVLMVALAIAPPIAARQWTTRVGSMLLLSGLIGAVSAVIGSWLAVSIGRVPTGPMIVLVVTVFAFVSILFAPKRSILLVALARHRHRKEVAA